MNADVGELIKHVTGKFGWRGKDEPRQSNLGQFEHPGPGCRPHYQYWIVQIKACCPTHPLASSVMSFFAQRLKIVKDMYMRIYK